jgi:hypothetical protein
LAPQAIRLCPDHGQRSLGSLGTGDGGITFSLGNAALVMRAPQGFERN